LRQETSIARRRLPRIPPEVLPFLLQSPAPPTATRSRSRQCSRDWHSSVARPGRLAVLLLIASKAVD